MRRRKFSWSTVYLIFVFILLYIPIFYLIFYSFNQGGRAPLLGLLGNIIKVCFQIVA